MMTESIDFLIEAGDGQRTITIKPINITTTSGILYATGQYDLHEGDVGMGVVTFTSDNDWTFDGVGDILDTDIQHIAEYIQRIERQAAADRDAAKKPAAPEPVNQSKTLTIIVEDKGKPVDVRVEMNYPFYDVTIGWRVKAQLEQDHHSNWFVTKGQLDDALVQAIGKRIAQYVAG